MDSKAKLKAARPGAQALSKPAIGDRCLACLPCACFQFLALYIQRNTDALVKYASASPRQLARHSSNVPALCSLFTVHVYLVRTGARGRRST